MSLYIGIDPGAIYTGVVMHDGEKFVRHFETESPLEVWNAISIANPTAVIAEDFTGSGRLNKYRKRTIMVLGYIQFRCEEAGIYIVVQKNDVRLPYVRYVPSDIKGKDEVAGAAHVVAYLVRRRIIRVSDLKDIRVQRSSPPRRTTRDAPVQPTPRAQLRGSSSAPRRRAK